MSLLWAPCADASANRALTQYQRRPAPRIHEWHTCNGANMVYVWCNGNCVRDHRMQIESSRVDGHRKGKILICVHRICTDMSDTGADVAFRKLTQNEMPFHLHCRPLRSSHADCYRNDSQIVFRSVRTSHSQRIVIRGMCGG